MPLYTYECVGCGHKQDERSSVEDRTQCRCCERCSQPAKLVPSVSAFKLKGAGFHVNDYPRSRRR